MTNLNFAFSKMEDKFTSKEILDYITEQSNSSISLTRKLSLYTKATEKNLEDDQYSLILWLNYIDILKICDNDNEEIRGIYKMLQAKFGRFLEFWVAYLEFERKSSTSNVKKIVMKNRKWLEMKEYDEKNAILTYFRNIIDDTKFECIESQDTVTDVLNDKVMTNDIKRCEKHTEENVEHKTHEIPQKTPTENLLITCTNKTVIDEQNEPETSPTKIELESVATPKIEYYEGRCTTTKPKIMVNGTLGLRTEQKCLVSAAKRDSESANQKNLIFADLKNLQIQTQRFENKRGAFSSVLESNGVSKFYSPLSSIKRLPKDVKLLDLDDKQILNGFYDLKNENKSGQYDNDRNNRDDFGTEMRKDNELNNKDMPKVDLESKKNKSDGLRSKGKNYLTISNLQNNTTQKDYDNTKMKSSFATNLSNIKFNTSEVNKENECTNKKSQNNFKFNFNDLDCKKDVTNQINKIFSRNVPKQPQTSFEDGEFLKDKKLQVIREIGKGGSCKVYQVMHEGKVYALKKVNVGNENETVMQGYLDEIKFLEKLKGKDEIIYLVDHEQRNGYLNILMEYGETDLANLIKKDRVNVKSINYMRSLWERMLLAVKTIHDARIVHRDLKPANFLLVQGKLKLIDFGISKAIRNDTTNINFESHVGTINYMAPEAVDSEKSKMGRSSDIWSLGCILYEIIYGYPPLHHFSNFAKKIMALQDKNYEIEYPEMPPQFGRAISCIKKCLKRRAGDRSTIEELLSDDFLNYDDKIFLRKKDLVDFTKAVWKINGNETINIKIHAEKVVDEFLKKLEEKRNKKR